MKLKDITGKNEKELKDLLKEKKQELFNLNLENKQHKLKNTRSIFNTRKDIARILTLIRESQLATPKVAEKAEAK
jgi:large subunit ribosomal protein L29